VSFGRFQVSPHRREFLVDGRPVQIGGRAFDVLMAVIDAQGSVVSKNALMERVWAGSHRALPRHQTVHATLEWSHDLLTASERVLLHRLAVFAGVFDLEAAGAVAASPELATCEVVHYPPNRPSPLFFSPPKGPVAVSSTMWSFTWVIYRETSKGTCVRASKVRVVPPSKRSLMRA
jgi:hypothetical protein